MDLSLYQFFGCPFCAIVRRAIDELGIEVEMRDIHESSERGRELVEATGRRTVPCLRIRSDDGEVQWLHESRAIIGYLRDQVA